MSCPLCRRAKARRACPALGQDICPVCCGTKRLSEIACPPDCVYLASARVHPPAVAMRQRQSDVSLLVRSMQDLSDHQANLLLLTLQSIDRYQPGDFHRLLDQDVVEATEALAATLETATRGLIYEHRAQSLPAERLVVALKQVLAEARGNAGTKFDRDAAAVLRNIAETASRCKANEPDNRRAFVEWLKRVMREGKRQERPPVATDDDATRLIVP
jgi:hypothetical protein